MIVRLCLLVPLVIGLAACTKTPEEKLAAHKAKAAQYEEQSKVDEAVIELRNALQLAPKDVGTLARIGELHLKKGQLQEAFRAFQQVAELDPKHVEALLRLGNIYLLGNSAEEARARAETALTLAPGRADAHLLLGKVLLRLGETDKGLSQLDKAVELAPDQADYALVKAAALLAVKRLDAARKAVEQVLGREPANPRALLLLAQISELQGDSEGARAALDRLLQAEPGNPGAWITYGNYWSSKGDNAKAADAYRKAATVDAKGTAGWEKLAEASLGAGDIATAREAVEAIFKVNSKSAAGNFYRARIFVTEKKFGEALPLLQEVVKEYPNNAEAHYFLGLARFGQGNPQLAKADLLKSVELEPAFYKARMLLAQAYLDSRDFSLAVEATDPLVAQDRVHPEVLMIRGSALLGLGKPAEARVLLGKLVKGDPKNARAHERLGLCYLAEKNTGEAIASFRRALQADPSYLQPLGLVVQVLGAEKKLDQAAALLKDHQRANGESPPVRELLGKVYAAQGKREAARTELERVVELDAEAVSAYLLLAQLHQGPDATKKALADVEKALGARPNHLQGWMMKGTLLDLTGEFDQANAAYRKALELSPEFVPALNNLAWNLSERGGNLDEALKFAEKAVERAPDAPATNDTLGWIYAKKGVYGKAVRHLELAAEGLAENPVVHYHLGEAYAGMEERAKAVTSLKKALDLSKDFVGAREAREMLGTLQERR